MSCLKCRYLSKDGSHLENDYLKTQLANDANAYTCKFPHEFRSTWVFGIAKLEPFRSQMTCAGEDFQPKQRAAIQLQLFN